MKSRKILTFLILFTMSCFSLSGASVDSIPVMKSLLGGKLPPETRLRYLTKICISFWNSNPDSSIWYGRKGIVLFGDKVSPERIGRHSFAYGMAWENKGRYDSALFYLRKAQEVCFNAKDSFYAYRAIEQTGSLYRIMGRYDTAAGILNRALDYFKQAKKNYQTMSVLFNIGSVYLEQNRYSKALEYYIESASYDSILGDNSARAIHLLGIGSVYLSLGELFSTTDQDKSENYLNMAANYFRQSLTLFEAVNMKTGYCFASMSLLSAMVALNHLPQADSLIKTCRDCRDFPDPRVKSGFKISLAQMYVMRDHENDAMTMLKEVSREKGEIRILPEFYKSMLLYARLIWNTGNRDSALALAEKSIQWARLHSVTTVAIEGLDMVAGWEKIIGRYDTAFNLLLVSRQYRDTLRREISKEIIDQIELRYRSEILQARVNEMSITQKYDRSRLLLTYLVAVFIILVLGIITISIFVRRRSDNIKRLLAEERARFAEKGKRLMEVEIQNMQLEKLLKEEDLEKVQLEIKLREQELVFQTIVNADLNQKNLAFTEKLGPYLLRIPRKKDQDEFAQTLADVGRESQSDPMQHFDLLFKQMHSGFLEKLLEACPDLSKAELQICTLLRLNLSSKDISRLINLTPASIDGTRHRIRKKLDIDQNLSLTSYLMMIK
jgi:tetratricopeptide (TPR) repeat protein